MNRRSVLKGMGAAAAMGAGAGLLPKTAAAADKMNVMLWPGYDQPSIIKPFQASNDVEVAIDLVVDDVSAFSKLAAGAWRDFDVVTLDSPWNLRLGAAGLCEFLNHEDFKEEYENMYPQFQPPFEGLLWDSKIVALPTRWGWVAAPINTNFTKVEEWRTYAPIFDQKNRDKICVMDWGDWPVLPLALYAGIDPFGPLDENELKEIRKVVRALFKNTRAVVADLTLAQKGLIDGSFVTLLGAGTYVTGAARFAGHREILTTIPEPKDGLKQGIIWLEATSIVKEPSNPELSKKFLKNLVSTDVSYKLSLNEISSNATANARVEELYTEDERDIVQVDYFGEAWDRSLFYAISPNVEDILAIYQEELARAK
jgi:spermidine/putrescine transport system substrate-binding protein